MSLLVTEVVGVYIDSPILRGDYVGLQDMDITPYGSMFGVIKDASNSLWDVELCLIQGTCEFVAEANTCLVTASSEISILGVAPGRYSKGSKMLRNFPLKTSFCHCDIGGVTKCACVIVHNIPSSGLVQE